MRKYTFATVGVLIALCILSGCGETEKNGAAEEYIFTVSADDQEVYRSQISDLLKSFYWKFDANSITFFDEGFADKDFDKIAEASLESGIDASPYKGKKTVLASCKLLHFNGEEAGDAQFYFYNYELAAVFYNSVYDHESIFSLKDRNVFTKDISFSHYEDSEITMTFSQTNARMEGFDALGKDRNGNMQICVIDDNKIKIYTYKNSFSLTKEISFANENLYPISAAYRESELCVLLGHMEIIEDDMHRVQYSSVKAVFFDENIRRKADEIDLSEGQYSTLFYDGDALVIANSNNFSYYEKERNASAYVKSYHIPLSHEAYAILKTDMNGQDLYFVSDNMDLYVYTKTNQQLDLIWRTHLSIESLSGPLFAGDLNNDGSKEIYISDSTGTTIRYILTEKGFISSNEDINEGEKIFPGDFNCDGKYDFIKSFGEESYAAKIYIME